MGYEHPEELELGLSKSSSIKLSFLGIRCLTLAVGLLAFVSIAGKLINWSVIVYGTSDDPLEHNKHVTTSPPKSRINILLFQY